MLKEPLSPPYQRHFYLNLAGAGVSVLISLGLQPTVKAVDHIVPGWATNQPLVLGSLVSMVQSLGEGVCLADPGSNVLALGVLVWWNEGMRRVKEGIPS